MRTPPLSSVDELAAPRWQILREHAATIGRTEPIDICFSPFADGASETLDELHALEELGVTWAVLHVPRGHDPRRVDRRGAAPRRRGDRALPRGSRSS